MTKLLPIFSIALALGLAALPTPSPAATRTWTGFGTNGFWTTATNWNGGLTAPVNGDGLVFPAGTPRLVTTNTVTGPSNLLFLNLSGSNYVLFSPVSLSITNGLTNGLAGNLTNTVQANLTVAANQTWASGDKAVLTLASNLFLGANQLTLSGDGSWDVAANITGTGSARLIKLGAGRLSQSGSSSAIPDCQVRGGTLVVEGILSGSLSVSNGAILSGSGTVPPFLCAGTVRPGGSGAGSLTVSAGTAVFAAGASLQMNLNGTIPGLGYDQLRVSSPPNLSGATLNLVLGFTPPTGQPFVIITNTGAAAFTTTFNGLPEGAQFTAGGHTFLISYAGGNGNDVTLTRVSPTGVTRTWTGGGVNSLWSTAANWVGGTPPNPGDALLFPPGAARLTNTNNYGPATLFDSLTFSNQNYAVHGNELRLLRGVHGFGPDGSSVALPITLFQPQTFTNTGTGSLLFSEVINAAGHDLTLEANVGGGFIFQSGGILTNNGSLVLRGAGRALINNAQPGLSVLLDGGTLGGTGTVGTITALAAGGVVSPGASPGTLTCSNVVWNSNTTFLVELNGLTPGSQYDRLIVNGSVELNNANLVYSSTFKPPIGTSSFTIIRNDGPGAITGTFANLPNGAAVRFGGLECGVFYAAGDGNDVVLSPRNNFVVWDGDAAATSTNWSNPLNWLGDALPASGDSILFPPGVPGLTNFNDLTNGFFLRTVRVDGSDYDLRGTNRLDLWDVVANNSTGAVSFGLTVKALLNPFRFTNSPGGTLHLNGEIQHPGAEVELSPGGTIVLNTPVNDLRKRGPGLLRLAAANPIPDTPNTVPIEDGTVQLLHDRALGGAYVIVSAPARIELAGGRNLTNRVFCQGVLAASGAGSSNRYTGSILGGVASVDVASNCVLAVTGPFVPASTNGLFKTGPGSLYLQTTSGSPYPTFVNGGTLLMVITNQSSTTLVAAGATLGGSGGVGPLTCQPGGVVSPGYGSAPAILSVIGTMSLQSGSTLRVQANNATPGSGYSQLRTTGAVNLTGATLDLTLTFTPSLDTSFIILKSGSAITGSFAGLAEGAIFTNNSVPLQITYAGGTGNDVVLTAVSGVPPPPLPVIFLSGGAYTQSFNSLAISGTANTWSNGYTLPGWYAAQSASPFVITTYRASTGADNPGALYSFGAASSSERALGSLASGTPGAFAYGVCFTNDTAGSVSNFTVSYTGEQWRSGGSGSVTNLLRFWYRVSGTAITDPEPGVTSGWTEVSSLNFSSPVVNLTAGALDGNQSANRQAFSSVVIPGLIVAPGNCVFFRWRDVDDTGADQGLAVDDLTISYGAPVVAAAQFTGAALTNGLLRLTGIGTPGASYQIQTATNFVPPVTWLPVGSTTAAAGGSFSFTDEANPPTEPMRFYRAVNP